MRSGAQHCRDFAVNKGLEIKCTAANDIILNLVIHEWSPIRRTHALTRVRSFWALCTSWGPRSPPPVWGPIQLWGKSLTKILPRSSNKKKSRDFSKSVQIGLLEDVCGNFREEFFPNSIGPLYFQNEGRLFTSGQSARARLTLWRRPGRGDGEMKVGEKYCQLCNCPIVEGKRGTPLHI